MWNSTVYNQTEVPNFIQRILELILALQTRNNMIQFMLNRKIPSCVRPRANYTSDKMAKIYKKNLLIQNNDSFGLI